MDNKFLNSAGVAYLWNKISSKFLTRKEAEDLIDNNSKVVLKEMLVKNDYEEGEIYIGYDNGTGIGFECYKDLPDNIIVYDVAVVINDQVFSFASLKTGLYLDPEAYTTIFSKPYHNEYTGFGGKAVAYIGNCVNSDFYNLLFSAPGDIDAFIIYYLEV